MKNNHRKFSIHGFSLIELTIVLTIAGLLLAAGAALYDIHQKKRRVDLTNERIESAQASLLEYARRNGFYPCPAPINAAIDTAEYATSANCNAAGPPAGVGEANGRGTRKVWIGALPTRTLGASGKVALDGWNQRLIYAVTKNLAVPSGGINQDEGAITLIDGNDNMIADGTAHYVLVSAGPDGKGAYSPQGGQIASCNSAPGKDNDNCGLNSATFRATENRATISGANHYDDFVAHTINLEVSSGIPPGAIMAFDSTNCPNGWETVPELSGRVIVGTGTLGPDTYDLGDEAGEARHTLAINELPLHQHGVDPPDTRTTQAGRHVHPDAVLRRVCTGMGCVGVPSLQIVSNSAPGYMPGEYGSGYMPYNPSSSPAESAAGDHTHNVDITAFNSGASGNGNSFNIRDPSRAFLYCKKQ